MNSLMFSQEMVKNIKDIIKEHISYPDDDFFIDEQDKIDYEWMPREDLKDIVRELVNEIWYIGDEVVSEVLQEYNIGG